MDSEAATAPATPDAAKEAANIMNLRVMLEDMEKQYSGLKQERDSLQTQLESSQKAYKEATDSNLAAQNLNSTIAALQRDLSTAKGETESAKTESKLAEERAARTQAESDRLREEIRYVACKVAIASAYPNGPECFLTDHYIFVAFYFVSRKIAD